MIIKSLVIFILLLLYWNFCYTEKTSNYDEIKSKIENGESFTLIVEKENCNYCEALNSYILKTKMFHPIHTVYTVNFDGPLNYPEELGSLQYTPTIYKIKKGKIVEKAVGFSSENGYVALDKGETTISKMKLINFWKFIK